jgi:hypothetical protein
VVRQGLQRNIRRYSLGKAAYEKHFIGLRAARQKKLKLSRPAASQPYVVI